MAMGEVRQAKLHRPRGGPWLVPRPRLEALLDQASLHLLTLVCASAGFGKTALLSQWGAHRAGSVGWLALDDSDNDLAHFVRSFVAAVQTVEPGVGTDTLALVSLGTATAAREFAGAFADDLLGLTTDLTIVLDDYHLIEEPAVHEFMTAVVSLPPPRLHLVIASRTDPPLPLSALRAHGQLAEIRDDELRFTATETESFLRLATGGEPDPRLVAELQGLSEGWITIIHLGALASQSHTSPVSLLEAGRSASRAAVEFLVDEVVSRQPEPVQALLARIAVPEHVSAELASVLAEIPDAPAAAQEALESIGQAGLFLFPLGEDHRWYRFHPVFRHLMLQRLEGEIGARGLRDLHRRASRWFVERGEIEYGVMHALAADDARHAVAIVARHAQVALLGDHWQALDRWLNRLPSDASGSDAEILLARCWLANVRGRYDVMRVLIDRLRQLLAKADHIDHVALTEVLEAELDLLQILLTDFGTDLDSAIASSGRAMEKLRGSGRFAEAVSTFSYGMLLGLRDREAATAFLGRIVAADTLQADPFSLARANWARLAQVILARHERDAHAFAQGAQLLLRGATRANLPRLAAAGHLYLGMALYETNRVHEAEFHARASLAEPANGILFNINAAMLLSLSLNAQERTAEADHVIDAMMDRLLESEITDLLPHLRTFRALLSLTRGDASGALARLGEFKADDASCGIGGIEARAITRATAWILERSPQRSAAAAELLVDVQRRAEAMKLHNVIVQVLLVQALLHRARGQDDAASGKIRQALSVAEQAGYVRTVVDVGAAMRPLLEWHARHVGSSPYIDRLLAQFRTVRAGETFPAPAVAHRYTLATAIPVTDYESLTEREVDVLLGLQRRLSNKEIADELSISPLTIKTHTRNIYGKLGVNSRRQAIARALELGLLPHM